MIALVSSWKSSLLETLAELCGGGRGRVLTFIASGWLFVFGMRFVFPAVLPYFSVEFGLSNALAGSIITAIWVSYAVAQLPAGLLSDYFNERSVLVTSMVASFASVCLVVAFHSLAVFVAASILFGLGTGLYGPPRVIALSNVFARHDSTAIALTFAAGSVGSAALPFVAGIISPQFGWRAAFSFALPVYVLLAIGLWWAVPHETVDAGVVSADGGTPSDERRGRRAAVAHLVDAVSDRAIVIAWAGIAMSLFIFQAITSFLPTYLVVAKDLPESTAATMLSVFFLSGAICQPVAGALADRYGQGTILASIAGATVLPLLALAFVGGVGPLLLLSTVLGTRLGLGPINNAYIVSALPADVQGAGYGLVRTLHIVVGSTGAVFVGFLADSGFFDEAFIVLAAVSGAAALLYTQLPEQRPSARSAPPATD
ncbi:MFS transporter [Halomarina halobia]|uniref:MFS transporter n=1 Tax=Halomarina halobia TaxID=3033386 RepID=A0ABD6AE16_9EURY|nr:MFS transporter [Halomarina sp. PSR21]